MASVDSTLTLEFTKECRELLEQLGDDFEQLDALNKRVEELETHSHPPLPMCSHTRALDLERAVQILASRCGIDGEQFIATIRSERNAT